MPLSFRPLLETMGVQVLGFDPAEPLRENTANELREALTTHRVLLFRDAPLTEGQQIALTSVAGTLTLRGMAKVEKHQLTSLVSNVHKDGLFGDGELSFHSDLSFTEHILKARSLHALMLPSTPEAGGETLFSDVQTAYRDLSPELKAMVEPLKARFTATYDYGDHKDVREFVRPLIDTHPKTGCKFIAASRAVTKEVLGMEREQFRPLLKQLWAHMEQPEYVYRHTWRLGDTLFWDNVAVQHARTPFDPREKRALRAVSIDEPSIAVGSEMTS